MSYYSEKDFDEGMRKMCECVSSWCGGNFFTGIHGVPRGGIPFATALSYKTGIPLVPHSECFKNPETTLIVDDLYDSGVTRKRYPAKSTFMTLLSKQEHLPENTITAKYISANDWVEFFWEVSPSENSATDIVTRMLQYIGEDITREGLKDTPKRVLKAWDHIFSGYNIDPKDLITTFDSAGCDEMVLLKDIELYSMCLAGSTFIETPKGRIPISRLKDGEWIYCYDESKCEMTLAKAKNPRITGRNKQLWRIYSDKDTILCTGNHKFLTHTRGWIEARNLVPGDTIVALNKGAIEESGNTRAYISFTGNKYQIPEHRFVYKAIYGNISSRHHIHHKDLQPNNNDPSNLECLLNKEHFSLHRKEDGKTGFALFTDDQRTAMKKAQVEGINRSQTSEVRAKRASSVKAHWDSLTPAQRKARNHRILLVEKTDWFEDVWCMDVPVHHNFVANGMVVHNCEHHLLPFVGKAHVAYIPNGKVIGVSKLARLVDCYARRAQIQERLGEQITTFLMEELGALGAGCVIEAQHLCMKMRGVEKQHSKMITSSLKGVFKDDPSCRSEFMALCK